MKNLLPTVLAALVSPGLLANCLNQQTSQSQGQNQAQTLKSYSVARISAEKSPSFVEETMDPDFKLNVAALSQGDAQFFGKLLSNRELQSPENRTLYDLIKKMSPQGLLDRPGDDISYLKLAYIIPHTTPNDFSRNLLSSEKYVNSTMIGTTYIEPSQENLESLNSAKSGEWLSIADKLLVTKKNLGAGLSAKTVLELSHCTHGECDIPATVCKIAPTTFSHLGTPEKMTHTKLLHSNYATLSDTSSVTNYYSVDGGHGTLVVTYAIAKLNFGGWFAGAQRSVAKNANSKEFPSETGSMIIQNRKFFAHR